jgi:hypothetical protein
MKMFYNFTQKEETGAPLFRTLTADHHQVKVMVKVQSAKDLPLHQKLNPAVTGKIQILFKTPHHH